MRATGHIYGVASFGHGSMSYVLVLLSLITPLTCSSAPFLQAEGGPPAVPPGHQRILRLLQQIADGTPDNNIYLGETTARALRKQLAVLPPDTSNWMKLQLRMQLGKRSFASAMKRRQSLISEVGFCLSRRTAMRLRPS